MTRVIPDAWMPLCKVSRIILHHTGGANFPSSEDKQAYHFAIDRIGKAHRGDHSILDNIDCTDDDYAAHTRGMNTGSVGLAICGMAGANQEPFAPGPYPILPAQWNAAIIAAADLCRRYRIEPMPKTLLMHAEVESVLKVRQAGKWDITIRSWKGPSKWEHLTPGNEMRARVALLMAEE